jgi:hypothetical protein
MQVTIEYPKPIPPPPAIVTITLNAGEAHQLLHVLGAASTCTDLYVRLSDVLVPAGMSSPR